MSLSLSIHGVYSVTAGAVHHSNANQISLHIHTRNWDGQEESFEVALFNLPTAAADHLSRALASGGVSQSEAAIRADERAKVTARFNEMIGGAA